MKANTLLAIDTSAEVAGVAIGSEGKVLVSSRIEAKGQHAEKLSLLIQQSAKSAQVDLRSVDVVVCAIGPGPYTGLRVGVMTALVMAQALESRAVGVSTHDLLAQQHADVERLVVLTQARRRQPAFSFYAGLDRVKGPEIADLAELIDEHSGTQFVSSFGLDLVGDGADERVASLPLVVSSPDPAVLLDYALSALQGKPVRGSGLQSPSPIYLRPADAREPIDLRGKAIRAALR